MKSVANAGVARLIGSAILFCLFGLVGLGPFGVY